MLIRLSNKLFHNFSEQNYLTMLCVVNCFTKVYGLFCFLDEQLFVLTLAGIGKNFFLSLDSRGFQIQFYEQQIVEYGL